MIADAANENTMNNPSWEEVPGRLVSRSPTFPLRLSQFFNNNRREHATGNQACLYNKLLRRVF